jgi:hypothetical protein
MAGKPAATAADGWTQVSEDEVEETKVAFDTVGDQFIGTYIGSRFVPSDDGGYSQLRFRGDDGTVYFTNANYSLKKGMEGVTSGTMCRLTYTEDKDVGQASPLRIFRVETRR